MKDVAEEEGPKPLEVDYLVIGAGVRGLAFVDALLTQAEAMRRKLVVAVVEERDMPGGHWNDVYTFARLHQPGVYYGVPSRSFGMYEKAVRREPAHRPKLEEVLSYYADLVEDLESAGKVRFFPMCYASADGSKITSRTDKDKSWQVIVKCKVVNSAYLGVESPQIRPPPFSAEAGALLVPPGWITTMRRPYPKYVVIGAGRTGIDTVTWLISRGVRAERIHWVVPRDAWFFSREAFEPSKVGRTWKTFLQLASAQSTLTHLCLALEKAGIWCRVDQGRWPETFHGAFVSEEELEYLRRVESVVRMGHVKHVAIDAVHLEAGTYATGPDTLHIDCAGSWETSSPRPVPVWAGKSVTLQQVQEVAGMAGGFNVPFAAAFIGFVEALLPGNEKDKNDLCTAARLPDGVAGWFEAQLHSLQCKALWEHEAVAKWLQRTSLSFFASMTHQELQEIAGEAARPLRIRAARNLEVLLWNDARSDALHGDSSPAITPWTAGGSGGVGIGDNE